jgi:hypothetical protein
MPIIAPSPAQIERMRERGWSWAEDGEISAIRLHGVAFSRWTEMIEYIPSRLGPKINSGSSLQEITSLATDRNLVLL